MALITKYHTLSNWTGVNHVGTGGSMTNSATDIPAAGTLTASGDYPSTAIYTNYNGTKNGSLNYRCERGLGITMVEGGIYWADFYAKMVTFGSSSQLHNDFSQVRDSASPDPGPSPSPAFSNVNGQLYVVRNLYTNSGGSAGPTLTYPSGSLGVGGGAWIHWQLGFKWTSGSNGWFEVWRNGVNTLANTTIRTARATAGASWRFGIYRDPGFAGQTVQWRLWGLEIHNTRPGTVTGPDPGTGTDTTGPTLSILEPVASQTVSGNLRYTINVSDSQSGVASVRYSLVGPTPATAETVVFTETSAPWDDSDDFNPFNTATLADGGYTFRVVATDVSGNATTANQGITLDNFTDPTPVNQPPFGVISPSDLTPDVGQPVTFFLSASDDGGDANLTYAWDFLGAATFTGSTVKSPVYTFTAPGTYVVRCRITDSGGLQTVPSATVVVSEPVTVPDPTDPPPDPTVPPPTVPGSPGYITRGGVGIAGTPTSATSTSNTLYPASTVYPSSSLYPGTVETPGRTRRR